MDPIVLTKVHSGIAILVILSYIVRGGLMLANSSKLHSIVLTAFSHTLVLVLILLGFYTAHTKGIPFSDGFVITKIFCLILFIVLGSIALKQGLSKTFAILLWLLGLALLVYAWMLGNHLAPAFF